MTARVLWIWIVTFTLVTWFTNSWQSAELMVLGWLVLACHLAIRKMRRES